MRDVPLVFLLWLCYLFSMSEPKDITATILRDIRDDIKGLRQEMQQRFDNLETRMEGVKSGLHGVQIILVNAVGMFDQRISALEAKVN
jgi:archaellum biogenesis protein FlaJ (TadC family)